MNNNALNVASYNMSSIPAADVGQPLRDRVSLGGVGGGGVVDGSRFDAVGAGGGQRQHGGGRGEQGRQRGDAGIVSAVRKCVR